jgi:integrase
MPKVKRTFSVTHKASGLKAVAYTRQDSPNWQAYCQVPGEPRRRTTSLRTRAANVAEKKALKWLRQIHLETAGSYSRVLQDVLTAHDGRVNLGHVIDLYEVERMPKLRDRPCYGGYLSNIKYLRQALDLTMPLATFNQDALDDLIDRFTSNVGLDGTPILQKKGAATVQASPVKASTARDRLSTLSRMIEYAKRSLVDEDGRPFIARNPVLELKKEGKWVRKTKKSQPLMTDARHEALLTVAPLKEARNLRATHIPAGYLRMILQLARWTGRRRGQLRRLRIQDVLFTPGEVRQALRANSLHAEWADVWECGAIFWSRGGLKQARAGERGELARNERRGVEYGAVIPMPERLRDALRAFIDQHPGRDDPDALLIPGHAGPYRPHAKKVWRDWLLGMEELAGLEHLEYDGFHAWRREYRSERKHFPSKLVAYIMDWSQHEDDVRASAMDQGYLQFDALEQLECVEYLPERDGTDTKKAGRYGVRLPESFQAARATYGMLPEDRTPESQADELARALLALPTEQRDRLLAILAHPAPLRIVR